MVSTRIAQKSSYRLRLMTDLLADPLTDPLTDRDVLVDVPMASTCEVCVIVPVCDEAELLESCLNALVSYSK